MSYLTEAFKQMELLESEQFTFDKDGAAKLANFLDDDMLNDFETIIDPEAEIKEEVKDSYMGDVICRCNVCKSLIYKDPEDIIINEKAQLANIEDECPFCFETGGYEIVGQVAPYEEISVEGADKDTKVEVDGQEVEVTTTTEESDEDDDSEDKESLEEDLSNLDKLYRAYPELKDTSMGRGRAKRHTRDNEDIEDCQRFPVEGTKQVDLKEDLDEESDEDDNETNMKILGAKAKRHAKDNEDLEDCQRYPIESPIPAQTGLRESRKLEEGIFKSALIFRVNIQTDASLDKIAQSILSHYKDAQIDKKSSTSLIFELKKSNIDEIRKENKLTGFVEGIKRNFMEAASKYNSNKNREGDIIEEAIIKINLSVDASLFKRGKAEGLQSVKLYEGSLYRSASKFLVDEEISRVAEVSRQLRKLFESYELTESMEDISITTDNQVIKVKATPRADKETIQPIEDETKDMIEAPAEEEVSTEEIEEESTTTDTEGEEETVDLEEVDEESLDTLGESYLKNVYENVNSFKTSSIKNLKNQMIVEGIISFNSGKKCKTKFIFEAKEATKSGKLKFSGLNENITQNKRAFTLTGSIKDKKLILESLNYNYSAKAEDGKSKRLYGTVRI